MIGYNYGWGKFQNDHFEKLSLWKISKWSFLIVVFFGKFKKVVFNSCRYDGKNSFSFLNGKRYFFVFRYFSCYTNNSNWFPLIGNQTIMRAL